MTATRAMGTPPRLPMSSDPRAGPDIALSLPLYSSLPMVSCPCPQGAPQCRLSAAARSGLGVSVTPARFTQYVALGHELAAPNV